MKYLTKSVLMFIVLLGTVLISIGLIGPGTIIESHSITYWGTYTWNYYTINLSQYLQNLEAGFNIQPIMNGLPDMPSLPTKPGSNVDIIGWTKFIACIMTVYILNWIIYIVNWTILLPLKIICYPLTIIYSIMGINTADLEYIKIIETIYNINIPLIPNF